MRLNHVALTVSEVERSAAFYGEHFGLDRRVHEDDHLVILASSDGSLLALNPGTPGGGSHAIFHFGFQVDTADEVRCARERFCAAGITEAEWQEDGPVRVQVIDPDGHHVEVFAY